MESRFVSSCLEAKGLPLSYLQKVIDGGWRDACGVRLLVSEVSGSNEVSLNI